MFKGHFICVQKDRLLPYTILHNTVPGSILLRQPIKKIAVLCNWNNFYCTFTPRRTKKNLLKDKPMEISIFKAKSL